MPIHSFKPRGEELAQRVMLSASPLTPQPAPSLQAQVAEMTSEPRREMSVLFEMPDAPASEQPAARTAHAAPQNEAAFMAALQSFVSEETVDVGTEHGGTEETDTTHEHPEHDPNHPGHVDGDEHEGEKAGRGKDEEHEEGKKHGEEEEEEHGHAHAEHGEHEHVHAHEEHEEHVHQHHEEHVHVHDHPHEHIHGNHEHGHTEHEHTEDPLAEDEHGEHGHKKHREHAGHDSAHAKHEPHEDHKAHHADHHHHCDETHDEAHCDTHHEHCHDEHGHTHEIRVGGNLEAIIKETAIVVGAGLMSEPETDPDGKKRTRYSAWDTGGKNSNPQAENRRGGAAGWRDLAWEGILNAMPSTAKGGPRHSPDNPDGAYVIPLTPSRSA